ncbi:hypothetical protein [Bacteroides sp. 224]|uniref:hypothetical protein n=1 Tax=Bacteroides sp. 224 TaxID=2302936 RepID=UPI0013D42E4A|nr:hypothetical protein [Bacteroides sp. 224]NDV64168.1 hypothetical protein [Bacteroides sp. 224]
MKYTLEIQKILYQVDNNKSLTHKDKVQLLKQAAAIADDNDDVEWGYDVRMQLLHESYYLTNDEELVTNFTWILNAYEQHPDWFDENDFLWEYKWVLGAMYCNPDVSMEQIESILEDFKTRLLRNGHGLRAYYDRLYTETLSIGQVEKAKEYLDLRNECSQDDVDNCAACTLDYELDYYLESGQFDEAYNRAQPLLTKQIHVPHCSQVPARTFCTLLYNAQKVGKHELAAQLFTQGENEMEEQKENPNLTSYGGMLISYLADKDKEKMLKYIERYIAWVLEGDGFTRYDFFYYMAEGLEILSKTDQTITLNLPTEFELYAESGVYNVEALKEHFYTKALELAEAFDKRNGCSAYVDRVKKLQISNT